MENIRIGLLIGSLRKESYNRKIANHLIGNMGQGYQYAIIEIGNLQLYNEDLEADVPESYINFRQEVESFDAFIFITAEYNRSVPAVLKNAIDVASRPYGKSKWNGKPAGIISSSIGAIGGFGANHHLRQSLVFVNMPTMQQPEAYIGGASKLFDSSGNLTNSEVAEFLKSYTEAYENWIKLFIQKR